MSKLDPPTANEIKKPKDFISKRKQTYNGKRKDEGESAKERNLPRRTLALVAVVSFAIGCLAMSISSTTGLQTTFSVDTVYMKRVAGEYLGSIGEEFGYSEGSGGGGGGENEDEALVVPSSDNNNGNDHQGVVVSGPNNRNNKPKEEIGEQNLKKRKQQWEKRKQKRETRRNGKNKTDVATRMATNTTGVPGKTPQNPLTKNGENSDRDATKEQQAHAASKAMEFLEARRKAYAAEGRSAHWRLRGTGYLYDRQSLLLVATLPEPTIALHNSDTTNSTTRAVVRIDDLMPFLKIKYPHRQRSRRDYHTNYCDKLNIWVRVNGPEIFAGSAIAVIDNVSETKAKQPSCHWEFPVDLRLPGHYEVDAKVLVWNGKAPLSVKVGVANKFNETDHMRCEYYNGGAENILYNTTGIVDHKHNNLQSGGFVGFKLYHAARQCCEICSRTLGCLYWANPPIGLKNVGRKRNGCELFFDEKDARYIPSELASGILAAELLLNTTATEKEKKKTNPNLNPNPNPTASLSRRRLKRPSKEERAAKRVSDRQVRKEERAAKRVSDRQVRKEERQLGSRHGLRSPESPDQLPYFVGCGWSAWFTLDFPCMSGDLDDKLVIRENRTSFAVVLEDDATEAKTVAVKQPPPIPLCTPRDEVALVDPSRRVGRYVRLPWPDDTECGPFEFEDGKIAQFEIIKFDPDRPQCWHRDDFARVGNNCIEVNCKLITEESKWFSSVHRETQWNGYWQNDRCDYLEFTTPELQECITERKISSIVVTGRSIATFFRNYIKQRLRDIVFYNATTNDGGKNDDPSIDVVVSTLGILHKAFGNPETVSDFVKEASIEEAKDENYYLGTLYSSSERDLLSFVDYQVFVHNLAEPILLEHNWTILDAYHPSAAFVYDTATQNDGMHIIGPPMKTAVTKFFHHLCHSNNNNSNKMKSSSSAARGAVVGKYGVAAP